MSGNVKHHLFAAVTKLKAFSERSSSPSVKSPISRTIGFMRDLWRQAISKPSHLDSEKEELLLAVETVNRQRFSIQQMQLGGYDDQEMAKMLLSAIESYNKYSQILSKVPSKDKASSVLNRFLSEKLVTDKKLPEIHVPQKKTVYYNYPQGAKSAVEKFTTQCAISAITPSHLAVTLQVPDQSADLFRMKVLSLLEKFGIASNPEARQQVRSSPIQSQLESPLESTCTLTQKLSLFPGQTIVVMGKSSLDAKSLKINSIIPETFSISLESTQTAYPHPSQRAGWSLVNELMPEFPQRIDLLSLSSRLFIDKRDTRSRLQPDGDLIGKAKRILRMKKKVFASHQDELILMHEQLVNAILEASSVSYSDSSVSEVVTLWFNYLKSHPFAYDLLVDTNQIYCDQFISRPFAKLHEAIIKGKHTPFASQNLKERYQALKSCLEEAFEEAILEHEIPRNASDALKWNYIVCMGKVLGRASINIFLQYLSEDLIFPPQALSSFEEKIQLAAYTHVFDFLEELKTYPESIEEENRAWCLNKLQGYIKQDIAIFKGLKVSPLIKELATYFSERHISLIAIE